MPDWVRRAAPPFSDAFRADAATPIGRSTRISFWPLWLQDHLLPLIPGRSWNLRLGGRHVVGPNDDLFAVLPLYRHRFVSGLITALIDGEVAEESLGPQREQRFPKLFGVQAASAPHGVCEKLTGGIVRCRLNRGGVVKLLLVSRNKLLIFRI